MVAPLPSRSVYLVEDSDALASRLAEVLQEDSNVQLVGRAEDSATAIEELHEPAPDAVLVDLSLRSGTGFDVLRAISRQHPAPIAIVLTNHSSAAYRNAAEQLGVPAERFFDKTEQIASLKHYFRQLTASRFTSLQPGGAIGPEHEPRDRHRSLQGSRHTRHT